MNNKINKIRTIFIGTSDFGIPAFRALIKDKQFEIVSVITQPDKPAGRKQILTPPPIKTEAQKYKIPVFQPERIADLQSKISAQGGCASGAKNLNPDIIIVIAYAQIIPEEILNLPKYGCVNVHGSLLPKYRGAACVQAAILNGDKQTGVTIIKMDKGLDTGPILWQDKINIESRDTAGALYEKLSLLGAKILPVAVKKYIAGEIKPIPQNNAKASYVKQLKKQDGLIDWSKSAVEIERFIRAMAPWPSAFSKIQSSPPEAGHPWAEKLKVKSEIKNLKITEIEHQPLKINEYKIGEVFLHNNKLAVQCGKDALIIKKLQLEGKKEMKSEDFIKGNNWIIGSILK
jgi:methionyl-tRNA formyltransferase